jgi:hypothetical protein
MSRRRRRLTLAVVTLAACAFPLGCRGGERVKLTLRYHPPAGATYSYTLEQSNKLKIESGPMAPLPERPQTLRMYLSESVTGATKDGVGMTVRFDSTTLDSPLMREDAYRPALDRMRGLELTVRYDDRMNLVHSGFAPAGGAPSPLAEQLAKALKGMVFPLPDSAVGVGDSWTAQMNLPFTQINDPNARLVTQTKMKVAEIHADGPDTTVRIALETTFPTDPISVMQQGQLITLTLSGSYSGEQLFSVTRQAVVRLSMGGTIHVKSSPASGAISMSIHQATSLQLSGAQ